jgi:hypothetical protein
MCKRTHSPATSAEINENSAVHPLLLRLYLWVLNDLSTEIILSFTIRNNIRFVILIFRPQKFFNNYVFYFAFDSALHFILRHIMHELFYLNISSPTYESINFDSILCEDLF